MNFKDKDVHDVIERLKKQYQLFVHNQFINYYLLNSDIPKNDWLDIEDLVGSNKYFEAEGYELRKIYDQIYTFCNFLEKVKKEILPRIQGEAAIRISRMSTDTKILFEMTVDNLPNNLKTFYNILIDLYINLKRVDNKLSTDNNMLYRKLPFISDIENKLNV
ncbi:MAG: hypothetical protein AMS17_19590 [Spirochaetes bacterium DG_61]|nr:MAG: hypothetical protein AMS17_19590 [Spirochaetes bacterium DG_61]